MAFVRKRYLVSAEEMKKYDGNTISYFGVPSLVLMERAALAVAEELEKRYGIKENKKRRALIAAGCGNNGGDGIAVGRILRERGYQVTFCLLGEREKCTKETETQLRIIEKYGCPVQSKIEIGEYDIIIDALFGVGLSRRAEGIFAHAIDVINQTNAYVCAVDIPSGIHADTGECMGSAVRADLTVTFAWEKRGHLLYPGCEYTGELVCADIGITEESFLGKPPEFYSYRQAIRELMPARKRSGNKGTFGKVLVIAGSVNMSGACELCARAAYRVGAGMVKIVTPEENRVVIQQDIPEALLRTYPSAGEKLPVLELKEDMQWSDCIIVGPGLGMGRQARELLKLALTESEKTLVIDADGLNLLAASEEMRGYLRKEREIILTPHLGEFARLYGDSMETVKKNLLTAPGELSKRLGVTMVCKDARTVVADWREQDVYLNTTGNDGMATAGMGDVLCGIIGGLSAQGMPASEAARLGVYLHGVAGDRMAAEKGRYALMASDVIRQIETITR